MMISELVFVVYLLLVLAQYLGSIDLELWLNVMYLIQLVIKILEIAIYLIKVRGIMVNKVTPVREEYLKQEKLIVGKNQRYFSIYFLKE